MGLQGTPSARGSGCGSYPRGSGLRAKSQTSSATSPACSSSAAPAAAGTRAEAASAAEDAAGTGPARSPPAPPPPLGTTQGSLCDRAFCTMTGSCWCSAGSPQRNRLLPGCLSSATQVPTCLSRYASSLVVVKGVQLQ